jgi:thermitase
MSMRAGRSAVAIVVILACIAPLAGAVEPAAEPAVMGPRVRSHNEFVPGQLLIRFAPDASAAVRASILASVGAKVIRHLPIIEWDLLALPESVDVARGMSLLSRVPAVAHVEPNWRGQAALTPNDVCVNGCEVGRQWDLPAVNAIEGFDLVPGTFYSAAQKKSLPPVRVAVIDTKIDVTMQDWTNAGGSPGAYQAFDARSGGQLDMAHAKDFVPSGRQGGEAEYHGTFIAGILGAAANNSAAIAGFGYRAEIIPITAVDGAGYTNAADLAEAIVHAATSGARVINMSLGIDVTVQAPEAVEQAIQTAITMGALPVAAAGNNHNDEPFYPAWADGTMAVTAVDEADRPGACSNYSSHTSVAAPGVNIVSLDPRRTNGLSVTPCGTSTAAPHVSALAAMLFAQNPLRTPAQVRKIIESTADDDRYERGYDEHFGHGRINFERALRAGDGMPVVERLRSGVPSAFGGTTTITAMGTAIADRPIVDAEYFVDTVGAPGTGKRVSASDGAFDERQEDLVATVTVPLSMATGVHHIFVRASTDGASFGANAVAVLIVDRTPPRITGVEVSPVATPSTPAVITFSMSDDFSDRLTYVVIVTRQLGGEVYRSEPVTALQSKVTTRWTPLLNDPGPMMITIQVQDASGNVGTATGGTVAI